MRDIPGCAGQGGQGGERGKGGKGGQEGQRGGRPRRQAADAFLQPHLSPSQNPVVDSKT